MRPQVTPDGRRACSLNFAGRRRLPTPSRKPRPFISSSNAPRIRWEPVPERVRRVCLPRFECSSIVVSCGKPPFCARGYLRYGLEHSKNRRSSGRHGNQHVRLRGAQISERDSFAFRRRWSARCRATLARSGAGHLRTLCRQSPTRSGEARSFNRIRLCHRKIEPFAVATLRDFVAWAPGNFVRLFPSPNLLLPPTDPTLTCDR
jgi:hypothetical protein